MSDIERFPHLPECPERLRCNVCIEGTLTQSLKRERAAHEATKAERDELRDDRLRALKRAHSVTQETQTCDEAVADIVRMLLDVRKQRDDMADALIARAVAAEEATQASESAHEATKAELDARRAPLIDLEAQLAAAKVERTGTVDGMAAWRDSHPGARAERKKKT